MCPGAAARCSPGQAGSWPVSSSDTAPSLPTQVHVSLGNVTGVRGGREVAAARSPREAPPSRLSYTTLSFHNTLKYT